MNKAELIDVLTEKLGTDRRTATEAVEHVVDTIVRAVHRGDSVTITGFGVFEQRRRAARVARNPRTGETVKVKPTSVPAFRPGAQFKAVIAGGQKLPATGPAVKRGAAAPATKAAAKKTAAKKTAAKKTAAKKAAPAKTTAAKKTAAKKAPAKTTAAKKTVAKKVAPAKTAAKKTAAKKAPAKTTAAKKTVAKKVAPAKTAAKKTAAKKAPAKTTAAKKTAAKKAPAKRAK
ncbi:HU family DNA-binding protein [Rhodococcus opacus]|uniref:HU family DNA-binding protein n=1 Tax=Rhodococcus opacus TaxID=37919 RepID=UPI0024765BC4|nr:HU family DNA-binding protein [Rhodococcus opacus]MDH6289040.1 DNA-binding protein HU-beta [Rhodococcus opacus]